MAEKKKTVAELTSELKSARSTGRNARERLKAYKEGFQDGMQACKEGRRD